MEGGKLRLLTVVLSALQSIQVLRHTFPMQESSSCVSKNLPAHNCQQRSPIVSKEASNCQQRSFIQSKVTEHSQYVRVVPTEGASGECQQLKASCAKVSEVNRRQNIKGVKKEVQHANSTAHLVQPLHARP